MNKIVEINLMTGERVERELTPEEIAALPPPPAPDLPAIDAERDRRLRNGFMFKGALFDSDKESMLRMAGAAQMAFMAIIENQAAATSLTWHGGTEPFGWISSDNTVIEMDALTVINLGKAAAAWEKSNIFAARELKNLDPIPADYADDAYWPAL